MSSKKAIIFSAPSGAGKTTIVKHLLDRLPKLSFSISACSRKARVNEIHAQDYYFLSLEEFKEGINNNRFLEWEEVYPNLYYGTLLDEIERIWNNGKTIIFDVDVQGGIALKKHFGNQALAVFVSPPSLNILEQRLRGRGTESEEDLQKRINKAEDELSFKDKFDEVLINDTLDVSCDKALQLTQDFLNR
jgi:guanylate kinase